MKRRHALPLAAALLVAAAACNAILGVEESTYVDPDGGGVVIDAGGSETSEGSALPFAITPRRATIRLPRNLTTTVVFDVVGQASTDAVTAEVALPPGAGYTATKPVASSDNKSISFDVAASDTALTSATTPPVIVTARRGAITAAEKVTLRTQASGTFDDTFGTAGAVRLPSDPDGPATAVVVVKRDVFASVGGFLFRLADDGKPVTSFGSVGSGAVPIAPAEDDCVVRDMTVVSADPLKLLVVGGCMTDNITRLWTLDDSAAPVKLGELAESLNGTVLRFAKSRGTLRVALEKFGSVQLLDIADASPIGERFEDYDLGGLAVVSANDRIIASGSRSTFEAGIATALLPDAALDTTWGDAGHALLPGFVGFEKVRAVSLDGGAIVVVGRANRDETRQLKLAPNGAALPYEPASDVASDLVGTDARSSVLVVRASQLAQDDTFSTWLERLKDDGKPDMAFGGGLGRLQLRASLVAGAMSVDADGMVLVVASAADLIAPQAVVYRIWP